MDLDLLLLEENAAAIANVADFQHREVVLTSIAGAGLGLTARADLPLGTLIIAEHAAAIADTPAELERLLLRCKQLDHVETLFCGSESFDVCGVVRLNAFSVEGDGIATANVNGADRVSKSSRIGLWCRVSRLNHSCRSNCHWNVVGDLMIVRASERIRAGDQLTVSYHPAVDTFQRTNAKLQCYGFECRCARCELFRSRSDFAEAETQLCALFDRLVLQHELRNPFPNPTKSLALATFLERCDELLPPAEVPFTSIRFQALTCLAMLENNASHFDVSTDCSRSALRIARSFLGEGARIEIEVAMNLLISLLLVGQTDDAAALLAASRDSFCVRHGVNTTYFKRAFQRYIDKVRQLESARQIDFQRSVLRAID
jgi:hypothetical protein